MTRWWREFYHLINHFIFGRTLLESLGCPPPLPVTANHQLNNSTGAERSPVSAPLDCSLGRWRYIQTFSMADHLSQVQVIFLAFDCKPESLRSVGSVIISSLTFTLTGLDLMTQSWGQIPPGPVWMPNLSYDTILHSPDAVNDFISFCCPWPLPAGSRHYNGNWNDALFIFRITFSQWLYLLCCTTMKMPQTCMH